MIDSKPYIRESNYTASLYSLIVSYYLCEIITSNDKFPFNHSTNIFLIRIQQIKINGSFGFQHSGTRGTDEGQIIVERGTDEGPDRRRLFVAANLLRFLTWNQYYLHASRNFIIKPKSEWHPMYIGINKIFGNETDLNLNARKGRHSTRHKKKRWRSKSTTSNPMVRCTRYGI